MCCLQMGIPELKEAIVKLKKQLSSADGDGSVDRDAVWDKIVQLQLQLHLKREVQDT